MFKWIERRVKLDDTEIKFYETNKINICILSRHSYKFDISRYVSNIKDIENPIVEAEPSGLILKMHQVNIFDHSENDIVIFRPVITSIVEDKSTLLEVKKIIERETGKPVYFIASAYMSSFFPDLIYAAKSINSIGVKINKKKKLYVFGEFIKWQQQ